MKSAPLGGAYWAHDPKFADRIAREAVAHDTELAHVRRSVSPHLRHLRARVRPSLSFKVSCTQYNPCTYACLCSLNKRRKPSQRRKHAYMAEHHLPPEPVAVGHPHQKGVHAGELKPRGHRYGYYNYYGGGVRTLCFAVLVLLLIVGITWLVLYVVYRPSDPAFSVISAAVLGLYNATTTNTGAGAGATLVAASFQFTLVLRNPSARSSARYDRLTAYAAYRGELLTPPAPLPPLAQDAGDAVAAAPVLGGPGAPPVPVANGAAAALAADAAYGVVPVRVVLLGRVKFVSGPFHGRWHSLYARCDLLVAVRNQPGGVDQAPPLGNPVCHVDT